MKTNALKTKTITCLFMFAILAFASCTQNEELEMAAGRAIKFQNSAVTKAVSTVTNGSKFMVAAYKGTAAPTDASTKAFAASEYITASTYGFTSAKYYDGISSYWFYGYAQATGSTLDVTGDETAYSDISGPFITFTTPETANVDIVTMTTGEVTTSNQGSAQAITFKHALSRVRFTAKKISNDLGAIAITKIELKTGTNKGTIVTAGFADGSMTAGTAAATTYTIDSNLLDEVTTTAANASTTDQKLYLVPQTLGANALVVTYSIGSSTGLTKTFNLNDTILASGTAYNFEFTIGGNTITFTTSLEDWGTENKVTKP